VDAPAKPFFVVSDIHIGAVPAKTERTFREFLDYAFHHAQGLLINGDLFDVWVPSSRFVLRGYVRVLAKLADITESGFLVYFVGGNHDAAEYGGTVLEQDTDVKLLPDPSRVRLAGFQVLVVHGDGIGREGGKYSKENRALRGLLRIDWLRVFAERVLSIEWLYERASRWSRVPGIVARHQRGEGTGPKPNADRLEAWALEQLKRLPDVDVVLAGHSHVPAWKESAPGRFYVNTGDWIEHMTYAVLRPEGGPPEVRRWPKHELLFPGEAVQRHVPRDMKMQL
jgi:UDP-2,3-diacylglucosamine hydrolase